jgi:hypothetical protein
VRDGTARAGRRRSTRDDIRGALATLRRVSADEIKSLAIGAWILGIGGGSSGFPVPSGCSSTTMRPVSGGSGREEKLLVLETMRSPFREIAKLAAPTLMRLSDIRRAAKQAGLRDFHFHDLRRRSTKASRHRSWWRSAAPRRPSLARNRVHLPCASARSPAEGGSNPYQVTRARPPR